MKNFNSSAQSVRPDKFQFVEVSDINASSIAGGVALASVDATADAYGASSYAYTNATTRSIATKHMSIAFGGGTALAIGDRPAANVSVYGEGDKVIQLTRTYSFNKNMAVSRGFVIAIDRY